ncbi:MAG: methyltransferase domain-containing protein [Pseudomonadota bacterium]
MALTVNSDPALIDRTALIRNRKRAVARPVGGCDFLAKLAVEDTVLRLSAIKRRFVSAVDLNSHGPLMRAALLKSDQIDKVFQTRDPGFAALEGIDAVADNEALPLGPGVADLIVSNLNLQFVNDLPGVLIQIRRALKPDGLFLGNLIGGSSLHELKDAFLTAEAEITGGAQARFVPFIDVRDGGGLLQRAGFALPVADTDLVTVRYGDPVALMRDLRAMGAANPLVRRSRRPLRKKVLQRAIQIYAERYRDEDGRIRASFEIISLSGWAPHESQQKPLRPGSAKISLKDVLETKGP